MKNKKRTILLAVVLLTLVALCCSCGETPKSPAELVQEMQAALDETPCSQLELVTTMEFSVGMDGGAPMEMRTVTTSDTTVSEAPCASYTHTVNESLFGATEDSTESETYVITEENGPVSYTNYGGVWEKTPMSGKADDLMDAVLVAKLEPEAAVLDEAVTQWEGRQAVCIEGTVNGDALEGLLDDTSGSLAAVGGDASAVDYAALSCRLRLYLEPETCLPMAAELHFEGMTEAMDAMFADTGVDVTVTKYAAEARFLSYEVQPAVTLPEGAQQKIAAWDRVYAGEADNGDGTYTIHLSGALVDVIAPEGFDLYDKDAYYVSFMRDDWRMVRYSLHYLAPDDGSGSVIQTLPDANAETYEDVDCEVQRSQHDDTAGSFGYTCDKLDARWADGFRVAMYYAWTPLVHADQQTWYLLVEVFDGFANETGVEISATLTDGEFRDYLAAASHSALLGVEG